MMASSQATTRSQPKRMDCPFDEAWPFTFAITGLSISARVSVMRAAPCSKLHLPAGRFAGFMYAIRWAL